MNLYRHIVLALGLAFEVTAFALGTPVTLNPPLGLPPMPIPIDNPLTQEKIDLGRKLFVDRRLSHNNTFSCAMCHVPEQGFTSHDLGTAIGTEGRSLRRNTPTTFNVGYQRSMFDDGREFTLENQVWGPLLNKAEMDMPSMGYVVEKVRQLPEYKGLFKAAFGGPVTAERIGQALASFERTIVSGNSRFDRWYYGGDKNAINPQEQRGFQVFMGKGRCFVCHLVGKKHALFTDHQFHNTGIGWERTMFPERRFYKVQLAPGNYVQVMGKLLQSFEPLQADVGRYEVTHNPKDRWAYKTPILRNVALTAPYMHDGSLATLEDVVEFYDKGGINNENKSPLLVPLKLDAEEKSALVAFLKTLTGDNVEALVKNTRSAPVTLPVLLKDPADVYMESVLGKP
ncbi:cytochrome-c peroxidase [Sulfuriferula plumbiphila]|uniref:cytochrome-c peroxidase n=1 Tax=Sulfuriferula plumbiphila TaxID=171865 RepID=UPI001386FDD6|nr:cytochrome c peroxidase [Sulfuriferula plumbiphila]